MKNVNYTINESKIHSSFFISATPSFFILLPSPFGEGLGVRLSFPQIRQKSEVEQMAPSHKVMCSPTTHIIVMLHT